MVNKINSENRVLHRKIGFIFLDEIHHLNHFITIAFELAKTNQVSILTFPSKHTYLKDSLKRLNGDQVVLEQLKTKPFRALTDKLKKRAFPRKTFWMKKNKKYLLSNFDALVFTDYIQHTLFKYRKNQKKPRFIFLSHGFAGRAYSYKKDLLDFDLNLISGQFSYNQLKERKLLCKQTTVIGYQKIDALKSHNVKIIFNNKKPVVLYNPHFTPPFSSWHFYGLEVLDFFHKNPNYNLIFAPHINLFAFKGKEKKETIPDKFFNSENIYIDLGSIRSVNMTYTKQADIYLGDVSSQVYEFMLKPRPCIFFNPENINYKKDSHYRFWRCGEVINTPKNLNKSLQNIKPNFNTFKKVQENINKENVYSGDKATATQRAAKTINTYLRNLENS